MLNDLDCPMCNTLAHVELIGNCACCESGAHNDDDPPDTGLHDNEIDEWWELLNDDSSPAA